MSDDNQPNRGEREALTDSAAAPPHPAVALIANAIQTGWRQQTETTPPHDDHEDEQS